MPPRRLGFSDWKGTGWIIAFDKGLGALYNIGRTLIHLGGNMKASKAEPGDVLSFVRDKAKIWRTVCLISNGQCWLNDGTSIGVDNNVDWESERVHFLVNPDALVVLSQFSCKDPDAIKSGQMMLFIEKVAVRGPKLEAFITPVFYDSRMQSFWSMSGSEFPVSQYLCIDLGYVEEGFEITYAGQLKLRRSYPSDI